jgi:Secretion system C-terminal sorting domain/Putative metal-binding motif
LIADAKTSQVLVPRGKEKFCKLENFLLLGSIINFDQMNHRKIFATIILIAFSVTISSILTAQCDPSNYPWGVDSYGFSPNPDLGETFVNGALGEPYEDVCYINIPMNLNDFDPIFPITVAVDSVRVDSITVFNGIDTYNISEIGLNFFCNNIGVSNDPCMLHPLSAYCINISGTPTMVGSFTVTIHTSIYLNIFGPQISPFAYESASINIDCDPDPNVNVNPILAYVDADNDGYGSSVLGYYCVTPDGSSTIAGDCNDNDATVYPGALEVCNAADDDCNGTADENLIFEEYYLDNDEDGYGGLSTVISCSAPAGYVALGGDCDDTNYIIYPGSTELCNDVDDNCDGQVNEGFTLDAYYADNDADGYGNMTAIYSCYWPDGTTTISGDCADNNAMIYPGATEICNLIDDDCNEAIDDGLPSATYYADNDNDGYGDVLLGQFCISPDNSSELNGDCDDTNSSINPSETEIPNNDFDENCDGLIETNVDEQLDNFKVTLYPNPADEIVTLLIEATSTNFNYSIYDQTGKLIESATGIIVNRTKRINLSHLPAGTYNMLLSDGHIQQQVLFTKYR